MRFWDSDLSSSLCFTTSFGTIMMEEDKAFGSQYSVRAIYFAAPTKFSVRSVRLQVGCKDKVERKGGPRGSRGGA